MTATDATSRRAMTMLAISCLIVGCGTTRMTDTTRAASEMLLVSQAIDNSVARLDLSEMRGRQVFLDTQYLDGTVDKGYLISSLRQHLLAHGAVLMEDRTKAVYVVEPRSGGVGTDKHSLLVGTPQMALPAVVPGVPSQIPEIALLKKTDQKGVAKLAVFAYNRQTGRAVWQSGLVEANSTLKDTWVLGAGPISRGSIRPRAEYAGEELPRLPMPFTVFDAAPAPEPPAIAAAEPEKMQSFGNGTVAPLPNIFGAMTGAALAEAGGAAMPVAPAPKSTPAVVPASATQPTGPVMPMTPPRVPGH